MIPRPATVEPAGPAPWRPRRGIPIATVLDALGRAGRSLEDGPPPSTGDVPATGPETLPAAPSAVLVALFEEDGEARVLLTRRSTRLRTHRGQVSFPGGRIDPGEDALDAAVREAREEIGLDPDLVQPAGYLPRALAFATGAPITPVVATLPARPVLVPNPDEVDRAFDASLADLAASHSQEWWSDPGQPRQPGQPARARFVMHLFSVEGEIVWGATARMLVDLLTTVLVDGA